jgi:sulfide:quinone oxidoreductase
MAKVVVLGSGFAGHTAALNLRRGLNEEHEVVVITPQKKFGYIPSFIWVGIGKMKAEETQFPLAPVYKKMGITYVNGLAKAIHPDSSEQFVMVSGIDGKEEKVTYDYLINSTGPKLNFAGTDGLGPEKGNSLSICTPDHATHSAEEYAKIIKKMQEGQTIKILIGTGHGMATCQGAAFEYIHNIAFDLEQRGLSDKADITWLSNEQMLGDFGVGGMVIPKGGYEVSGKIFAESAFIERGIKWITGAAVTKVEKGKAHYKTIESSEEQTIDYDFSMLIPAFAGVDMEYINDKGEELNSKLCVPNNMLKVDADYGSAAKGFSNWKSKDWPKMYNNPDYPNVYAAGIAFAPPHPISKPASSPDGTPIVATAPRTGMAAAIIGHAVASSIIDIVNKKEDKPVHSASMADFGAACIASMGASLIKGSAASIVMYPVVPNFDKYETGRDTNATMGDMGLAGHWLKFVLHHMFMWKMQAKPLWWIIPD